ncbi:hypothetical protein FXN63_10490 [Pigmentiphaga aceris]|uniref:Uncharacterized protein n=1 Tax=Pigmentiphaga aceris TaxID=1940612 RepID=A0A5C0AV45_9BURK|nr:hypothetical protein [Pigmentiphaga aceris]QEI06218.1 hypothetical protein FXN63_10490 [Pigmentiphaga aceris]
MSISIYYSADRDHPLSEAEQRSIDACIAKYPPPAPKRRFFLFKGEAWESFCVYARTPRTDANRIFQGATKLSGPGAEDIWEGVQHWCALLTEIRRVVPDAQWDVSVDDQKIVWDDEARMYRPELE